MGYEYKQHENPYINQLANKSYKFGAGLKRDFKSYTDADRKGTLGNLGFNRMFDAQIAKGNMAIDAQYDPFSNYGAGAAGGNYGSLYRDRLRQMNEQEGNMARYDYAQNMVNNSRQSLMEMFNRKNQFEANNLATAAGLENGRYNLVYKKGFGDYFSDFLGGAMQAGSQLGGAAIMACDERLKENIEPYAEPALEQIESLKIYEFDYNGKGNTVKGRHSIGVMAQESPEVSVPLGIEDYQGVDAQKLLFMAIKAIQELSEEVKRLKQGLDSPIINNPRYRAMRY